MNAETYGIITKYGMNIGDSCASKKWIDADRYKEGIFLITQKNIKTL